MSEATLHPRATEALIGHEQAEQDLLKAWHGNRLHHALIDNRAWRHR
ncbi:MAG: hypothetical protein R3E60_06610 [Alphaproteobacteria bacterium]